MTFEEDVDLIDAYLDNSLTEQGRLTLESRLEHDSQFKALFDRQKFIREGIQGLQAIEWTDKLAKIETRSPTEGESLPVPSSPSQSDKVDTPAQKRGRNWPLYLAFAAGIALLLSAGIWLWGPVQNSPDQYASQHYFTYHSVQLRTEMESDAFATALDAISKQQWLAASRSLETHLAAHPNDLEASFVLADVYHQSSRFTEAMNQWQQIISQNGARWVERAQWNYVCSAVAHTSYALAKVMLSQILDEPTHFFHDQASELSKLLQ